MTTQKQITKYKAANKTLEHLGYSYHGGEMWAPPIGTKPNFDLIDRLRADALFDKKLIESLQDSLTVRTKERDALLAKARAWDDFVSLQSGDIKEMANKAKDYDAIKAELAGVCAECGKKSSEGFALYCVECSESTFKQMENQERTCYDGDGNIYAAVSAREASEEDIEFHKRLIEELKHENHNLNVALGTTGYEEADWFSEDERATSAACNELIQARIERMQIQKAKLEEQAKDAARLNGLRELMGYVEDGSSDTVKLFQDDATKSFFVTVGKKDYYSTSFKGAIDEALSENEK